jgi:putative flippase GtrA
VGGSTFAIDLFLLLILHDHLGVGVALATTISYWIAIVYNFILNRYWTFSLSEKSNLHKHLGAYLCLLAFNYLFTVIFVSLVSNYTQVGVAKVLAVAIQITWTYKIYKDFIFIDKK